ncbi:hypothetical protein R6Z07F_001078 [Ovis aries]
MLRMWRDLALLEEKCAKVLLKYYYSNVRAAHLRARSSERPERCGYKGAGPSRAPAEPTRQFAAAGAPLDFL